MTKKNWMGGLLLSLLIVIGLPVAARQIWLYLGPPRLDLYADYRYEFQRLAKDCQNDELASAEPYIRLQRFGLIHNQLALNAVSYFCGFNSNKYAECFLDLARHHLDDRDTAKEALLKAMSLGGWNGQQAAGIFVGMFADEKETKKACNLLSRKYDIDFATRQLRALRNQTSLPQVRICALTTLGSLYKEKGNEKEARNYFESARDELAALDPNGQSTLTAEIAILKSQFYDLDVLGINQEAPEIEGELQDGTFARLSDFRKKVVFLDFWGDW